MKDIAAIMKPIQNVIRQPSRVSEMKPPMNGGRVGPAIVQAQSTAVTMFPPPGQYHTNNNNNMGENGDAHLPRLTGSSQRSAN